MAKAARILVVDDEIDSVDLLVMMLIAQGYDPVGATSPAEAIAIFEEEDFDAVISDLIMPDIDGWDLREKLIAINPNVPILALTARAITGDRERVLEAGFSAYLSKPVLMNQLSKTLGAILSEDDAQDSA